MLTTPARRHLLRLLHSTPIIASPRFSFARHGKLQTTMAPSLTINPLISSLLLLVTHIQAIALPSRRTLRPGQAILLSASRMKTSIDMTISCGMHESSHDGGLCPSSSAYVGCGRCLSIAFAMRLQKIQLLPAMSRQIGRLRG